MLQDLKKYLFGEKDKAYQEWLFPQNKSMLVLGLMAIITMTITLSIADFFFFEKKLPRFYFFDWMLSINFTRTILFPILTIGTIFLSISKWNNTRRRLEWIGISNILFAFFSSFHASIINAYYTADDFSYEILPLIIFSQLLYGLSFRTSFILNVGLLLFTILYSIIDGTTLADGLWTISLLVLTWVSLVIANLKLEQHRTQNFYTISALSNAKQEIEEQKQLLKDGEIMNRMFSWKVSKDFKNISFSEGIYNIYEIDKSITDISKIVKIMFAYIVPEHQDMISKSIAIFLKGNIVDFPAYKISLPNGKTKWLKTIIEDRNNTSFLYGTIQDVTTEKVLELELKKQSKKLQSRNEDLEQFAYASSHDLQEPLRTITNFTKILNRKLEHHLNDETRHFMELILGSTSRMSNLISDILDYSQIGKHKTFQHFNSNIIIKNVIQDLNYSIVKSDGKVIIENKLPHIFGFKTEFTTLVQNIIGNALKFQREDVKPIVIIRSYSDVNSYHFSIQDNGIGMEQKHADKIFGLFSRLHAKDKYQGTGIGLTHSKKIVELHGGKIWVKSTLGKGTTFHFSISKDLKTYIQENENQLQVA